MRMTIYLISFIFIPVIVFAHSPPLELQKHNSDAIANQEYKEECGTIQALKEIRKGIERPRPSSGPKYINTTNFRIHFDTTGTHVTTRAYAESTALYAETCRARLTRVGWIMPPPDGTNGGDSRYDIYIKALSGYLGVCYAESPYTTPYPDGYSSWVEVINGGITYSRLRALVVHEIHHGCQYRYSVNEYDGFYDNSSVFIEDIVYNDVNTLPVRLGTDHPNPLTRPQWKITVEDSSYAYRGALWLHFLDEYYEATVPSRAVCRMWELCGSHDGNHSLTDIDSILRINYGSNLLKALGHYAIWRYFCGARDDGRHYEEGSTYIDAVLLRTHNTYPAAGNQGTSNLSGPGGCNFITFTNIGNNRLTIYFDGLNGYDWSAYVLGIMSNGESYEYRILLEPTQDTGRITIPGWDYTTVVLIPVVTHWTSAASNLTYTYQATRSLADQNIASEVTPSDYTGFFISPNPAKNNLRINYFLPHNTKAILKIYNANGQVIKATEVTSLDNSYIWKRTDNYGKKVANGIYFVELISENKTIKKKVLLLN